MKKSLKFVFVILLIIITLSFASESLNDKNREIRVQNLTMHLDSDNQIFSEVLLAGEIEGTKVNHIILAGPLFKSEPMSKEFDSIFLFIKGEGKLLAGDEKFSIKDECISLPTAFDKITIEVAEGDTLHYLKINKKLSEQDLTDIKALPIENRNGIYFTTYDACEAYTEKIKSPNTVSRTILPKNHIPRVAMGTVETIGPDAVGAHEHPMLDQLFLGLSGNNVTVHADNRSVHFGEFSLLHIPIGSSHWVTVKEGKRMYYQWMDFFLTKKGEEWLKTHKPVEKYKK